MGRVTSGTANRSSTKNAQGHLARRKDSAYSAKVGAKKSASTKRKNVKITKH